MLLSFLGACLLPAPGSSDPCELPPSSDEVAVAEVALGPLDGVTLSREAGHAFSLFGHKSPKPDFLEPYMSDEDFARWERLSECGVPLTRALVPPRHADLNSRLVLSRVGFGREGEFATLTGSFIVHAHDSTGFVAYTWILRRAETGWVVVDRVTIGMN